MPVPEAVQAATPAAEPAFTPHTETPTLLEESGEKPPAPPAAAPLATEGTEAAKPADATAEDAAKEPDAAVETPPAPAPEPMKYEAPTLPEGVTLDLERIGKFDEVIGTHQLPAEARQQLIDMYLAERQSDADRNAADAHRAFAETRRGWREQVKGDPEIGGSGIQTSMAAIGRMRDLFVAPKDRAEFSDMLRVTGAGDHPALLRFLHNVSRRFDEAPPPPPNPRPPPDIGKRPGAGGRADWYDHGKET